jgi:hypothetical protein
MEGRGRTRESGGEVGVCYARELALTAFIPTQSQRRESHEQWRKG